MTQPLNIGVLGSGTAGRTLATGFLQRSHPVMIGSRAPGKLQDWLQHAGPQARTGTFAETAQFGDLVVLSVNGRAAEEAIRLAGIENLNSKIVLDASDPLDFSSGRPGLFVGTTDSLGERIQRLIPNGYVVKGLNIVQAECHDQPEPDRRRAGHADCWRQRRSETNLCYRNSADP